ncbi:MAG: CotH kinase family protein [Dehalococcoidia bacterium]|nr:CotH kinase family protein [Dehalococcoidia bacterium]
MPHLLKFSLALALILLFVCSAGADILINEYLAGNVRGIEDADGDHEDWIEIYNPGAAAVNLAGYGLSDDFDNPFKWVFPQRVLLPGDFVLVFASGKDRYGAQLHSNFKIDLNGETLTLVDPQGLLIDTHFTGVLLGDVSRGRFADGEPDIFFFDEPTPEAANDTVRWLGIADPVVFSMPGGMYAGPVSLELEGTWTDTIRYSIDGSIPTDFFPAYMGPIAVDTTTTVRARAFRDMHIPSRVVTRTYIIDESFTLPVLCVTADPIDLFDPVFGIYATGDSASDTWPYQGANFWEEWEKPAHIEFFDPEAGGGFMLDSGIKIHGGWSRAFPQKSLRLVPRDSYGFDEIEYPLFPDRAEDEFKRLTLRNCGQDFPYAHCRDVVSQSLLEDVDLERMSTRAAIVFLNGMYWGYMNLREHFDKFYLEQYFGIDPDAVDIMDGKDSNIDGTWYAWLAFYDYIAENDMSLPEHYDYITTQMDIASFIQYNVFSIYLARTDWPDHNTRRWRTTVPEGRWRWFMIDLDHSLAAGTGAFDHNTLDFATNPDPDEWGNPLWSTLILNKLLQNSTFRDLFISYYADHMNSILRSEFMQAKLAEVEANIAAEVPRHKVRWEIGGSWQDRLNAMRQFIDERPFYAKQHILDFFDIPDTLTLSLDISPPNAGTIALTAIEVDESWSGTYFAGVPIALNAVANPGFSFQAWSDPGLPAEPAVVISAAADTSLTALFVVNPHGGAWARISEINYHSSDIFDPGDWVEFHNPGDQDLDLGGWVFKDENDSHSANIPAGTVLPAGGFLVLCEDLDDFEVLFPNVLNVIGGMDFGLSNGGELLRLFDDSDALVDSVEYDDSPPWPPEPDGYGPTLEMINAYSSESGPGNWAASINAEGHGTPGQQNSVSFLVNATGGSPAIPEFQFKAPYPNPFNPATLLRFHLPERGSVRIEIFDIRGRSVALLHDGILRAGWHEITWQPERLGSGVYPARLSFGGKQLSRKLILLK